MQNYLVLNSHYEPLFHKGTVICIETGRLSKGIPGTYIVQEYQGYYEFFKIIMRYNTQLKCKILCEYRGVIPLDLLDKEKPLYDVTNIKFPLITISNYHIELDMSD